MSSSLYLMHDKDQFGSPSNDEGTVIPLLRRGDADTSKLTWAYAVRKPAETGALKGRRKNDLVCAWLVALGFQLDANNSSSDGEFKKFNFYHLPETPASGPPLIDPIATIHFVAATLPDRNSTDAFKVLPPGGASSRLKLATSPNLTIKTDAIFKVHQFEFASGAFVLGTAGNDTEPAVIDVQVQLSKKVQKNVEFPMHFEPILKFNQVGNALKVNGFDLAPNNDADVFVDPSAKLNPKKVQIAADKRHDRLITGNATLVREYLLVDDPTVPTLAIEIFPSLTFRPHPDLPVTITIGHHGVCVRLKPRTGSDRKQEVRVNHLKPCFQVVIEGPVIHADAEFTGAMEAVRLLEPAERKIEKTIEQLNDFLTYSFEVCLPTTKVAGLNMAELFRLEQIKFEIPTWPFEELTLSDLPTLGEFFRKIGCNIPLPDVKLDIDPIEIDFEKILKPLGLTFVDFKGLLNLPDLDLPNAPKWNKHFCFRLPDGRLLTPDVASLDLTGFKLKVRFTAAIPELSLPGLKLELAPPDLRLEDLDFRFPDLSIPSLNQFELPLTKIGDLSFKIELPVFVPPDSIPNLPDLEKLWTVDLKRPGLPALRLKIEKVTVSSLEITFKLLEKLDGIDLTGLNVVVRWAYQIKPPTINDPFIEIRDFKFPTDLIPKIAGIDQPDIRLLKLRVIRLELDKVTLLVRKIDLASFSIKKIEGPKITLDVPKINEKFPALAVLFDPDIVLEFGLDLTLPLTKCFLSDLLGDLPSIDFRLSVPRLAKLPDLPLPGNFAFPAPRFSVPEIVAAFGSLATPIIPFELVVRVPRPGVKAPEFHELRLVLGLRFDLLKFRLLDNRIYFFLPQMRTADEDLAPRQVVDCDIFTLTFPNRPEPMGFPTREDHDGYLDINSHEFVIDLKYTPDKLPTPPPRIRTYFPGGMSKEAAQLGRDGVESLAKSTVAGDQEKYRKLRGEYTKRFELELFVVDPTFWPNSGPNALMFRFNSQGLTFAANLGKTEVEVDNSGFNEKGETNGSNNGLIKPFKLQPQEKQRELKSRLVIIDNELKEAGVYAKTEVPGVDGLIAEVSVVLRQVKKGTLPQVIASMELERNDSAPIAEFSIKLMQLSLERILMGLIWRREERDWDYSIIVDGTISFTGAAALVPDLEGLRAPSIQVIGLDLRRLNLRELRVPFHLVKPIRFEILDGLFGVELGDLELAWEFTNGFPRPRLLACQLAKFEFKNPGALEVKVTVGGLNIEFRGDFSAHIKLPSSLGIEVALGPTARFAGRVGWVETDVERYLFASGKVILQGFPEIQGLLKFGTGLKLSGRREINLVLYGETDLDEQLFPGAVVKSLGLGIGLNNRLSVIPPRPSAEQVIARIDQLKPGEIEGWQFVREGGFYLSVIGSVTLASNLGGANVLNAYVAQLVVSIDTNFDLVAAGKFWLSCTLAGVRAHLNNPAFVGAMVLSPSQRKLEIVLESRKNAFVEQNELMKKLLDKGRVRFAFRMTPELVDYHLAELSYLDDMFGVLMEFRGEYRFAIFKRAVLLKSELSATGSISRSLVAGPGGFDMQGKAHLRVGYGGLLSDRGIMAYAFLDAGIRFRVSAWIEIGFSISFRVCGKRFTFSWTIVFRVRAPELELTFRGFIAASDRGGLVGVDVQVGINIVICGYALRASGRLAVNPELYQEVRAQVAAFEAELEQAVRALNQTPPAGPSLAPPDAGPAPAPAASSSEPESWLYYTRKLDTATVAMLLPVSGSKWLTPTIASVRTLTLSKGGPADHVVAKFSVTDPNGPLAPPFDASKLKVRLLGLRGEGLPKGLDGAWPVKEIQPGPAGRAYTIVLDIGESGVPIPDNSEKVFSLFGGVWRVEEPIARFVNEVQHDTVPYLGDVERVVLRNSDWFTVSSVNAGTRTITLSADSHLTGNHRFVLERKDASGNWVTQDLGAVRRFDDNDRSEVTFLATANGTTLKLADGETLPAPEDRVASAIEIAPTWNARNRLAAARRKPEPDVTKEAYIALTGSAAVWAETARYDEPNLAMAARHSTFATVFDERYTSADPRFTDAPAGAFAGVLSARFKPIDQVEIVGADRVLDAARRFEEASVAVARQELHGALDLLDAEAQMQSQAQASNLLVHRFSDPAGIREGDHDEARFSKILESDPSAIVYGWLFSWGSLPDKVEEAFVRRAGEIARPVEFRRPSSDDAKTPLREIRTLPIRQEFLIDEANPVRELGRVSVKLPIKLPETLLRKSLEDVGRFQIYRQLGSAPEVLIADHLRPDITFLEEPQVFSRIRQIFVRDPDAGGREEFLLSGTAKTVADKHFIVMADLQRILPEVLEGFEVVTKTATRRVTGFKDGKIQLNESAGADGATVEFELRCPGLIVQRPVLFSDDFATENREFVSRDLSSLASSGNCPTVRYTLRALTEEDPGGPADRSQGTGTWIDWADLVPIFIPPESSLPPNLALAIPVASLIAGGSDFVFQLVDMSGDFPVQALRGRFPLPAGEFELGLDDERLNQSGLYAGDAREAGIPRDPDGEKITLNQVDVGERTEVDVNQFVGFEFAGANYKIANTVAEGPIFVARSYRLHLRARADATRRSHRLPILLVRELPKIWDETVRFRTVETLELVPPSHVESVIKAEARPVLVDFSADDLYAAGRSAVRAVWPSNTMMEGGVELQFRDFDDSSMRSRTLVEVQEAGVYSISQQDFRHEDFWIRRPADQLDHYASRVRTGNVVDPSTILNDTYTFKRAGKIDVVDLLDKAKTKLAAATDWLAAATAAKVAQTALLAFEKSPLNLNKLDIRNRIEVLRIGLRLLIVGPPSTPVSFLKENDVPAARKAIQDLMALLNRERPEPFTDANASEAVVLDRGTARKLTGIVRRRLAIADEVFALKKIELMPGFKTLKANSGAMKLARQDEWTSSLADAKSLVGTLPESDRLRETVADKEWDNFKTLCQTGIEKLIADIEKFEFPKFVPRAAGLLTLIKQIETVIDNHDPRSLAALIKRPHHELTMTKTETGEIVAKPAPLRSFLSSVARRTKPNEVPEAPDESMERLGLRVGQVALLDNQGVSLWTTRGASIHTEPMRRVQQIAVAGGNRVELGETADGPVVLVQSGAKWELFDAVTVLNQEGKPLVVTRPEMGATFAKTLRGLEILSTVGDVVKLLSADSPNREPSIFKNAGVASYSQLAYFEEANIVAATNGQKVHFWRDMGRPENTTVTRPAFDAGAEIRDVLAVMLPAGPRFVLVTDNAICSISPFTSVDDAKLPIGAARESAAIDRREFKAIVRMGTGDKAEIFDLLEFKKIKSITMDAGAGLAVLHGRHEGKDESYLVGPTTDGRVRLYFAPDADTPEVRLQTLPKIAELGGGAGAVAGCAAALMTARTSRADAEIVNLLHLWERMGFAVDVAAQVETTRLMTFNELRAVVDKAIAALPRDGDQFQQTKINGLPHYIYVFEGEEPDAEFRSADRVGFSHVKIAVVPEAFLVACLKEADPKVLDWLDARSVDVGKDEPEKPIRTLELNHLSHLTRLVGVPTSDCVGTIESSHKTPDSLPDHARVRLQPRSEQFVTVPESAGFSHWTWRLPDRKGHRMMVAARSVSRYEPLLRWWLNLHTRFDLLEEVPLSSTDKKTEFAVASTAAANIASVSIAETLMPATGWQPLRLEIVSGAGAGQRRGRR